MVWGIASQDSQQDLERFRDHYGITYPILKDVGGRINSEYAQEMAFPSAAYPQDWVIGADGTIVYGNNGFELDAMVTALEGELSE